MCSTIPRLDTQRKSHRQRINSIKRKLIRQQLIILFIVRNYSFSASTKLRFLKIVLQNVLRIRYFTDREFAKRTMGSEVDRDKCNMGIFFDLYYTKQSHKKSSIRKKSLDTLGNIRSRATYSYFSIHKL